MTPPTPSLDETQRWTPAPQRRYWPAVLLVIVAAIAVGAIQWAAEADHFSRQIAFLATFSTVGAATILLFLWFVLFSGAAHHLRFGVACGVLVLIALAPLLFRVKDVSGNLIPRFSWRFMLRPDERLPRPKSQTSEESLELTAAAGEGYPGFLGANRTPAVTRPALATDWSKRPPRALWGPQPIGAAWSAFAVVGSLAVTQEQRGEQELVTGYDLHSGRHVWSHATNVRFFETIAGIGPRATPTIDDGQVFAMGAMGHLTCLDAATGREIWQRNVVKMTGATPPVWGKSCSPLVYNGLVIVSAGGPDGKSLLAFDKLNGALIWSAGNDPSSYSSPMLAMLAGVTQILIVNVNNLTAHNPANGKVLWQRPWPGEDPSSPSCSQPLLLGGDCILLGKGYGVGSAAFEVRHEDDRWTTRELWKSNLMKTKFTNAVLHEGFVFGLDEGVLECIDPATGKKQWKQGKYGHGQILLVGDLLVVQSEEGELALVAADPKRYEELTRFKAIEGRCWNTMALTGNKLLIRSNEQAACYELPEKR